MCLRNATPPCATQALEHERGMSLRPDPCFCDMEVLVDTDLNNSITSAPAVLLCLKIANDADVPYARGARRTVLRKYEAHRARKRHAYSEICFLKHLQACSRTLPTLPNVWNATLHPQRRRKLARARAAHSRDRRRRRRRHCHHLEICTEFPHARTLWCVR